MEYYKKLYEKEQELDKEIADIEGRISKLELKKKKLESKLENDKETSQLVSKTQDIETMG